MTLYSKIDGDTEYITTEKRGKRVLIGIAKNDILLSCHDHLSFNYIAGCYYLSKGWEKGELSECEFEFKCYRIVENREEKLLERHPELKYQDLSRQIKNTFYEEEKHRIRFLKEIEFLQKYENGRYDDLIEYASVLKLKKEQFKKLTTCINEANYTLREKINFSKTNFKTFEEYKNFLAIKYVLKNIPYFEKDEEKAKSFIKCLKKWDLTFSLKKAVDLYDDACRIEKRFIGFPRDLKETHDKLIKKVRIKECKKIERQRRKAKLSLSLKKYGVSMLITEDEYKTTGDLFHNCIAAYYEDTKMVCGVISKENEPYACVSVNVKTKEIDQLYLKFNKALEKEEYNKIKRSLELTV